MSSKGVAIVPSEFASYGTIVSGPPDRPEKSEADRARERAADRIGYLDVLKTFRWDDTQFGVAQTFGFPTALGRKPVLREGILVSNYPVFSRKQIAAWRERLTAFVGSLPKK